MQYTKVFNQINKNDTKIAGGKGASLGEMAQAKIPVPEGFVIDSNHEVDKKLKDFQEGDILVATQTYPALVPAMKKALAIITDEGGLTCHAAIVSRELGKPCIIGTHLATKTIKIGDIIRMNLNNGKVEKMR